MLLFPQEMRRIAVYIYQRNDGPRFHWDQDGLANQLAAVRHRQGRLIGRMEALGFRLREEAVLSTLTQDVLKSAWFKSWVIQVTLRTVPMHRPWGFVLSSDR